MTIETLTLGVLIFGLFILSPMVIFWIHGMKQNGYNETAEKINGTSFKMPDRLWLLSPIGVLLSICLWAFLYSLILILTLQISRIHWAILMAIYGIYWFTLTLIIPAIFFNEHKDDYIDFSENKLNCILSGDHFDIPSNSLLKVVERRGEIILFTTTKKKYRFPNNQLLKFNFKNHLVEQLRQYCIKK